MIIAIKINLVNSVRSD